MFGGDNLFPPAGRRNPSRQGPVRQDILIPSISPGYYAHYARQPNTNQHVRMLHYQQKKTDLDHHREESGRRQKLRENMELHFEKHAVRRRYQKCLEDKIQEKWQAYEATVEERRRRLYEMLSKEEREFYYETVDAAQKGADQKMQEMKQRAEMLKAKREAERLEVVHQKRIEQYRQRCQELRPALAKQHLKESKYAQLQQMRENEARRESDRELEKMWHELTLKEMQAKKEREVQEMLKRQDKEKVTLKVWDKQIKGKRLLKEEMDRVAQEDKLEMTKLSEQLRKEEIKSLDEKRRKRDAQAKEILDQIEIQKQLQAQRKKEENALDQAFATLTQLEIEKEAASIQDATEKAKRETAMYRKHLQQLDEERKQEEKQLMELLEIHRKAVEAKQDEARCKIKLAKQKLQQDVLAERAQQINYKKLQAEQQLKLKEAENELLRMSFESNERLQAESDRLEKQAVLQYRDDLQKQIQYNNLLRQREREELERMMTKGMEEENKYRKIVEQISTAEAESGAKHPFRKALENHDCYCPSNN